MIVVKKDCEAELEERKDLDTARKAHLKNEIDQINQSKEKSPHGHPFVITSTKYWGASLAKESATKLRGDSICKLYPSS